MFSLLAVSLLLALPNAHAGTYVWSDNTGQSPTYSLGQTSSTGGPNLPLQGRTTPYSGGVNGATYGGGDVAYGPPGYGLSVNATGQITAAFTWKPAFVGDLPPASAIVEEDGTASYSTNGAATGNCNDCVGDTSPSGTYASLSGTKYLVQNNPGNSFSVTVSPSATASAGADPNGSYGSASVSFKAIATPVTVTPVGAVQDQSGNWDILIGQQCAPILAGLPSGCTVSDYQWKVSGSTFQTWTANNSSTAFTDGPGPLNVAGPSWYWYDAGNNTHVAETVSCTVTVTPPTGEGSAFSVAPSQTVNVYIPAWTATGTTGTMQVSTSIPNVGNGSSYWLWAGGPGMAWQASASSPLPGVFGTGTIELVQTYTPGISYTTADGTVHNYSLNGQNGLDTTYPYPWATGAPAYSANDNPGLNLTAAAAVSGSLQDQFQDYLMYEPQGSSQFVPLAKSSWATSGSAQIPATGWANFSGSAGTVSGGSFSQSNTFPSWTQNVGNGTGHF